MFGKRHIYLDHSATTPVHPAVIEAMLPYWTEHYGNPSSTHQFGRMARRGLESARLAIAQLLKAKPHELIFTASGSEGDNLILRGVVFEAMTRGILPHLITSAIEHKAVLDTAKQLQEQFACELTVLPVDGYGRVDPDEVRKAIRPNTVLISIMAASNEIGTLQPIEEIGLVAANHGVLFHTDAVQAMGTSRWDVQTQPVDLLTLAPHKFGGPKGIGVVYIRTGIHLFPVLTGGGQEDGLRPGTQNVAFAVGAAKALALAQEEREATVAHHLALRDQLIAEVLASCSADLQLTGHPTERLPFHASFAVRHLRGNELLMHLDLAGIAASSGSACSVGNPKPSYVLEALGLDAPWTSGGLRFTVGRGNSADEIAHLAPALQRAIQQLQSLRPYHE